MSRSGCYHYYTLVTTFTRVALSAPPSVCAICVWMSLHKSLKAGRTKIFVQNLSKFNQHCVQNESHHLMQQRIVHDIILQSVIKDALCTGSGIVSAVCHILINCYRSVAKENWANVSSQCACGCSCVFSHVQTQYIVMLGQLIFIHCNLFLK